MKTVVISGLSALLLLSVGGELASARANPSRLETQTLASTKQNSSTFRVRIQQSDTLYLSPKQPHDYTLRLDADAVVNGRTVPAGSIVRGSFQPVEGGLRYVATAVEVNNQIVNLNATSEVLHDQKDPRETSTGSILGDAAIGAAGGYILGEVLGDASTWEVIGGAAAGVIVGNVTAPQVVVIKPDQPITLTLG
jgi:hypothetical protein